MKKAKEKSHDLIVEDVIYFQIDEKTKQAVSTAKETFYYQFLMDRKDSEIDGQNNLKAAEDFDAYEKIFVYLYNKNYLTAKDYLLDWQQINGGYCFSFNLGKLLETVDLEAELLNMLQDECISEQIKTFCNPADRFRCNCCGAVSFSRHLEFDTLEGPITFCLSCHPLEQELQNEIRNEFKENGSMSAIQKRFDIINDLSTAHIADGETIDSLLERFKIENIVFEESMKTKIIRTILANANKDKYEVFETEDFGIIIWDRNKLQNLETFSECFVLNEEGTEILVPFKRFGIVFIDNTAISFAESLTTNEDFIKVLEKA